MASQPVCSSSGGASGCGGASYDTDIAGEEPEPPASVLARRQALVPPKLLTDGAPYDEHDTEPTKPLSG